MHLFILILTGIGALIALLLLAALFMKRTHFVRREILIRAPRQEVFDFLKLLRNQEKFNRWASTDSGRKETFRGTDGTVGYVYAWSGNKSAGEGEKEIIALVEGERVETEIRFIKPMATSATVLMEMEPAGEHATRLYMTNSGRLPYPFNALIPVFQKTFGKDMSASLVTLKGLLEKTAQPA